MLAPTPLRAVTQAARRRRCSSPGQAQALAAARPLRPLRRRGRLLRAGLDRARPGDRERRPPAAGQCAAQPLAQRCRRSPGRRSQGCSSPRPGPGLVVRARRGHVRRLERSRSRSCGCHGSSARAPRRGVLADLRAGWSAVSEPHVGLDEHRLLLGLEPRDRAALRARPVRRDGVARRRGGLGSDRDLRRDRRGARRRGCAAPAAASAADAGLPAASRRGRSSRRCSRAPSRPPRSPSRRRSASAALSFSNALWFTALQRADPARVALPRQLLRLARLARASSRSATRSPARPRRRSASPRRCSRARPCRRRQRRGRALAGRPSPGAGRCALATARVVSGSLAGAWGAVSARSWSAPPKGGAAHDGQMPKAAVARGPDRRPTRSAATRRAPRGSSPARAYEREQRANRALPRPCSPSARRARAPRSRPRPCARRAGRAGGRTSARSSTTWPRWFSASVRSARLTGLARERLGLARPARRHARSLARIDRHRNCVRTSSGAADSSASRLHRAASSVAPGPGRARRRAPPPASRGTRGSPDRLERLAARSEGALRRVGVAGEQLDRADRARPQLTCASAVWPRSS